MRLTFSYEIIKVCIFRFASTFELLENIFVFNTWSLTAIIRVYDWTKHIKSDFRDSSLNNLRFFLKAAISSHLVVIKSFFVCRWLWNVLNARLCTFIITLNWTKIWKVYLFICFILFNITQILLKLIFYLTALWVSTFITFHWSEHWKINGFFKLTWLAFFQILITVS